MIKRVVLISTLVVLVAGAGAAYYWVEALHPPLNTQRLTGSWDDVLNMLPMEFKPDASFVTTIKGTQVTGTYTFDAKEVTVHSNSGGEPIHLIWKSGYLIVMKDGVLADIYRKQPPISSFTEVACHMESGAVLADSGGGNYSAPGPKLKAEDSSILLMPAASAKIAAPQVLWHFENGVGRAGPYSCFGYRLSVREYHKELQLLGDQMIDSSKLPATIFIVHEVR